MVTETTFKLCHNSYSGMLLSYMCMLPEGHEGSHAWFDKEGSNTIRWNRYGVYEPSVTIVVNYRLDAINGEFFHGEDFLRVLPDMYDKTARVVQNDRYRDEHCFCTHSFLCAKHGGPEIRD